MTKENRTLEVEILDRLGRLERAVFESGKPKDAKSSRVRPAARHDPHTPTGSLRTLHEKGVFKVEMELKAIEQELAKRDCNFPKPSLAKALERADFLTRRGKRGSYRWIQRYPPKV